ncbi:hypothetical protein BC829DRAFT_401319 [Chytridium lagenaria]|nr:hypothetical protein BC829DRAFT_401319 [Chytridium lagenaria]
MSVTAIARSVSVSAASRLSFFTLFAFPLVARFHFTRIIFSGCLPTPINSIPLLTHLLILLILPPPILLIPLLPLQSSRNLPLLLCPFLLKSHPLPLLRLNPLPLFPFLLLPQLPLPSLLLLPLPLLLLQSLPFNPLLLSPFPFLLLPNQPLPLNFCCLGFTEFTNPSIILILAFLHFTEMVCENRVLLTEKLLVLGIFFRHLRVVDNKIRVGLLFNKSRVRQPRCNLH